MKLDKYKIMDIMFYSCLVITLVFIYLKLAGYINTPPLVEMIPYAGIIFAVGVFYQRFVQMEKLLGNHETRIRFLENKN